MKIAYIDPYPVPDFRVASLQILQNVDAFARQGHEVCLITPAGRNNVEEILGRKLPSSVELIALRDMRRRWYFPVNTQKLFYFQVSCWLRKHKIDAIFTRNIKMANYLLHKHPDIPHFFESHEIFSQSFKESHGISTYVNKSKYSKLRKIEQHVYQRASAIFVLTSLLRDDIYTEYCVKTPIIVAPDGVDLLAVEETKMASSGKQYQKGETTQVLYLGSLHRWKGVPTAMKSMCYLNNAVLNIAGGNSEQIEQLKFVAQQIGVSDRVNFMGFIHPKDRFRVIADNDICILPLTKTSIGSRYTSPLKLFEYMAMGKPVVISDFPSIRDAVDEKSVSFAHSENAESFAQQIQLLIDNPAEIVLKTEHSQRLVEEHFNWDQRAKLIMQEIEKNLS
ncbi:glycosyltransferase family 4 protein [Xenorhabdus sp. PB30.3]|uniref:glycosyltransferase family 4 protein n=1 Tax=Xenorhabdus sp. PB30.3 TaxID=2788941 RepID=UPI001E30B926|nr:glycosyltransferase family 4 protein [Xenorhabdus sp. PB30.3]MCC8379955.1 glycosyltransferase family 4 protein [Xenorhabdus sp. PB30.3]